MQNKMSFDTGASPTKSKWKTTQCSSMHFEVIFEFKKVYHATSENIEVYEHL